VLSLAPNELFESAILNADDAAAVVAGLLLWADCLDEAHKIIQEISTTTGSFWHGIMHRREPDYENSRYWFQRVGDHLALPRIYDRVLKDTMTLIDLESIKFHDVILGWGQWIPEKFVTLCEASREESLILQTVQASEIEALLDWCYIEVTRDSTRSED